MMTSNHEPGPQLDALVASALGLDVLGMAAAVHYAAWYIPYDGVGSVTRPVYLTECVCDKGQDYDAEILGHIAGCLEVVPCYSTDDREALAAVDTLLDPIKWKNFSLNWHSGEWCAVFVPVELDNDWIDGIGATPALAICRAIVAMGEGAGNGEPCQG